MSQAQPQQQQAQAPVVPAKGTPEYVKHMAAKWDASQAARVTESKPQPADQPAKPQKPEGIPDKFWNAEKGEVDVAGLAKSYTELEKGRGKAPQQKPVEQPDDDAAKKHAETKTKLEADVTAIKANKEAKPEDVKKAEEALAAHVKTAPADAAQDAVTKAGLDWNALGSKLRDSGNLEETDYAALEKAGIPREVTQGYVEIVKEAVAQAVERSETYVGGKPKLDAIMARAATELTPAEKTLYNAQLASKEWKNALDVLKNRFGDETDQEPKGQILNGTSGGSSGGFANKQEMVKAMSDPRYKSDAAYRATVRNRVAISKF